MASSLSKFMVQIFASCNPHWAHRLQHTLNFEALFHGYRQDGLPENVKIEPLHHVFPTVSNDDPNLGLMVGVSAKPAPEGAPWQLSDAFGRMGYGENVLPLDRLLQDVENAWDEQYSTYLPIRWLTPLQIKLITPVHLDLIDGESLRAPLLLALLRAACAPADPAKMPWGAGPVFCTGGLDNGVFDQVDGVEAKLRGFIREFGPNRVAVLTRKQQDELKDLDSELLAQVRCETADSVEELLALPPMRAGLSALVNTPPDLDRHLALMESKDRQQHFGEVRRLVDWMKGHVTEEQPYYFIQLGLKKAAINGHRGKFTKARPHVDEATKLADSAAEQIGIDLHLACLTRGASVYFDMGRPEIPVGPLEGIRADLRHASPRERAAYWGTLCQHYRALGRHDDAVDAGEQAVKWARFGCVSEAYRDWNYLAHACIARAKVSEAHRDEDLARAGECLIQSEGPQGPKPGSRNHCTNLYFCEHLRLEIARLQGEPGVYRPYLNGQDDTIWEHPVLFSLLSLVRNPAVTDRAGRAEQLLAVSTRFAPEDKPRSIFQLFKGLYQLYVQVAIRGDAHASTAGLRAVLDNLVDGGADGWRERLTPLLDEIEKAPRNLELFEALCDAVYYH